MKKTVLIIFVLFAVLVLCVSCSQDQKQGPKTYTVNIFVDETENPDVLQVLPGSKLSDVVRDKPYSNAYYWHLENDPTNIPNREEFIIDKDMNIYVDTCFVAGTQVSYDLAGHTKAIETFKPGDNIVSFNLLTGKYYIAQVRELVVHDGNQKAEILSTVVLEGGTSVVMTPNHPVYTAEGFKTVDGLKHEKLNVGDFVHTINGYKKVVSISIYASEPTVVYNLKIRDFGEVIDDDTNDTFIVEGITVHNSK